MGLGLMASWPQGLRAGSCWGLRAEGFVLALILGMVDALTSSQLCIWREYRRSAIYDEPQTTGVASYDKQLAARTVNDFETDAQVTSSTRMVWRES